MRGVIGIVVAGLLVAGCQQKAELTADGGWVRLPAVAGNPASIYFTIHGGSGPATLLKVGVPFALRTAMHESMKDAHGTMSMEPIRQVAVAPRSTVRFEPGGKHVMIYDVAPSVQPGQKAPVTLSFADGKNLTVEAIVVGAGDPEPK